ncbi:lipopolysaccharide biosynthesis protein [Massilia sp. PAMC28688]|uniref:GNVR domain-containing protein n=1 Tax=Massilia sp. PAMC28688 TaxID=2861283 RepID=UPI001C629F21|nr:GNVR domain-containing protein [Massilia sp. PAMC28688]QYF91975.1 lipopolysaccharide biosynthesis protein [Massilia sp. PAMC28688]
MSETSLTISNEPTRAVLGMGLIDMLIALARRKKLVLGLPLASACAAALISLALPNTYRADTKLLPPQQSQGGAAALLAQLGGVAAAAGSAAGIKNPGDLYVAMLRSRTVTDKLVNRFQLKTVYGAKMHEQAREALDGNTVIAAGKDGVIRIDVEDRDPKLAVALANAYAAELLNLTKSLAVSEASQRRLFFERQFEAAKDNLAGAEVELKRALDTRGVISVDGQSRAMVETVGRLRAQIAAKEIELAAMAAFVTPQNPNYQRVQQELASMKGELGRQENGSSDKGTAGNMPQTGLENIKILRDVKYYQMLYELLGKQYELARLDEAKEGAIVQILDPAVEPERKYKPRRSIIVISFFMLGLLLAMLIAILLEGLDNLRDSPLRLKWMALKSALKFR